MRAGGGHAKGATFERKVGQRLSLWVSAGERADIFSRNILSGGTFTNQLKKGSTEFGQPGDLRANHPLAFDFMRLFCIECKHYADLNFEAYLFEPDRSFLGKVLAHTRKQAKISKQWPLIIAQQNRRPPVLICDAKVGRLFLQNGGGRRTAPPSMHFLHGDRDCMMELEELVMRVPAYKLMPAAAAAHNIEDMLR